MDSVATVRQGPLEGITVDGTHAFLGVPYAKSPRRHDALAPAGAAGRLGTASAAAKHFGPIAISGPRAACFTLRETRQSEDCALSLNVWTASLDRGRRGSPSWFGSTVAGIWAAPDRKHAYDGATPSATWRHHHHVELPLGGPSAFFAHPDAGANFGVLDVLLATRMGGGEELVDFWR